MGHITAAIEQQCRICKASAPKENIKNIKREHSNYFLINYVSNEKICSNCIQKYEVLAIHSIKWLGDRGYFA